MVNEALLREGAEMKLEALDLKLEMKSESIVLDPRSLDNAPAADISVAKGNIAAPQCLGIHKVTWQEFGAWMRGRKI
jgi:hypothetical protein